MPVSTTTPRKKQYRPLYSASGVTGELNSYVSPTTFIRYGAGGSATYGTVSSADGSWVFMAYPGSNGQVVIYHISGLLVGSVTSTTSFSSAYNLYDICVSPDGNKLAVLGGTSGEIWNTTTKSAPVKIGTISLNGVYSGAFTPDGTKLVLGGVGSNNNAYIVNASTCAILNTVALGAPGFGTCISPDGTKAYVSMFGSDIKVINITSGTVTSTFTSTGASKYLAITPDGSKLIVPKPSTSPPAVHIISTTDGSMIQNMDFTGTAPLTAAVSPDGKYAAIGTSSGNYMSFITLSGTYPYTMVTPLAGDGNVNYVPSNVCWISR